MKNAYVLKLNEKKRIEENAVKEGMTTMALMLLIASDNILKDYMPEERIGEVLVELEKEINRLYNEILQSVPSGEVTEMAERVIVYVDEIRAKRGMEAY